MYGMTDAQEKALATLCGMAGNSSFVAGQACDVLNDKPEAVVALLKALCVLGALECPQTPGLEVPRYRISRECLRRVSV